MQAPTYILAGVIINRAFKWRNYRAIAMLLTFICCLFVRAVFDKLSLLVYQPQADFGDPFWLTYHVVMWLATIVMLYVFWRDYKWGIIFLLIPEFDWLILGAQRLFKFDLPGYRVPWIHFTLNYVLNKILPFNFINLLPDHRNNPWACIFEFLLIGILALILRAMVRYRKNIHF